MTLRSCVVIPGYNVAETIGPLVRQIKQLGLETIVVDDGSTDQTALRATEAGATVISHVRNQGKGCALRTGFAVVLQAGYDAVVTLDSDGQHDPTEIPRLLDVAARSPAGIVVGYRHGNGSAMPLARRWTNRVMSFVVSSLTRQRVPDSQCGFRVIRCETLKTITLSTRHFDIETELLLRAAQAGWTILSIPIATIYNHHASHIHPWWDGLRFLRLVGRHLFDHLFNRVPETPRTSATIGMSCWQEGGPGPAPQCKTE